MLYRRSLLALLALAPLALAGPVRAAESVPFTPEAFAAAQKAGKPILVEVSAPWCPICKTQKPILATLAEQPRFKDLVIFDVDFDTRKDVLEKSALRSESPSATTVPRPTALRNGFSCWTAMPKFDPVWTTGVSLYPMLRR